MSINAQALQFQGQAERPLSFEIKQEDPFFCYGSVIIPASLIDSLYKEASLSQQFHAQTQGFHKGEVPFQYITEYFKSNITSHLKELIFKYFVVGFLYQEIRNKKLVVAGEPRLIDISIEPSRDAVFTFELSLFPSFQIQEWKYLPFKAPKRKNYKDLDRQVETFIDEEKKLLEASQADTIAIGDWVNFEVTLLERATDQPLLGNHKTQFWIKLGDEEADTIYHDIFLNKKVGDSFISSSRALQNYFNDHIDASYHFLVTIKEILKNSFFCLEHFKRHFKLKTNKELYQKLIEVFSYRNDLSLRRSMAEESLKLLLSKHRFSIPNYLILRQQKNILDKIKTNPDFHVYRMQKDFQDRVKQLAEKQMRELIFLDQLAYHEDLEVADGDLKGYLNLTNRQRMKDFLYFDVPVTKVGGQELPMVCEELNRFYLREKALNHIIYHLMKK